MNMAKTQRAMNLLMCIICAGFAGWASIIDIKYLQHGMQALEDNNSLRELTIASAIMFVSLEMAAMFVAATMSGRELFARKWGLIIFSGAVFALGVITIVATQIALTTGSDDKQLDLRQAELDIRKRIADLENQASIQREFGLQQGMAASHVKDAAGRAWAMQQAAKTVDKAQKNAAELQVLNEKLAGIVAQKKPTVIGIIGKDLANYYSVFRGVMISLGGLVFFGAAGAFLRLAIKPSDAMQTAPEQVQTAPEQVQSAPKPSFVQSGLKPNGIPTTWSLLARKLGLSLGFASLAGAAHALPTIAPQPHDVEQQCQQEVVAEDVEQPRKPRNQMRDGRQYDIILEDVRACIESNHLKNSQRAIKGYLNCGWELAARIQKDLNCK